MFFPFPTPGQMQMDPTMFQQQQQQFLGGIPGESPGEILTPVCYTTHPQ